MTTSSHRVWAVLLACVLSIAIAGIAGTADAAVMTPIGPWPAVAVPAGNNVAKVSWKANTERGPAILGYVVWPYLGRQKLAPLQYDATTTTRIVTGLQNGGTYHFVVRARNSFGTGPGASTPKMTVGAPFTPHAPTKTSSPAPEQLQVVFKAPKNGGAPITSYTASCTIVGNYKHVTATGPPQAFKGAFVLHVNVPKANRVKRYSCRVQARNSRGTGPLSASGPAANVLPSS